MPKPGKYEQIQCNYFIWRLSRRGGVRYADGRSNRVAVGRHSLGTRDKDEALCRLRALDQDRAVKFGLVKRDITPAMECTPLILQDGAKLYTSHISRPEELGGAGANTQKRYRTVFDKFIAFATASNIRTWNEVDEDVLTRYAIHLKAVGYIRGAKKKRYCHKTLLNELTTLKQAIKWMSDKGHLRNKDPINLPLRKAESERPYCWKVEEVAAIVDFCRQNKVYDWLADVCVGLACTGLRISELASLRWADISTDSRQLTLTDERVHATRDLLEQRRVKSHKSRSFPVHDHLLAVVQTLPRHDAFVFHGPRGGRLKPDTARNALIRVLKLLANRFPSQMLAKGFADGRLHSFRHYFCSRCANSGVPEQMLMLWLGHQDSEMVRHYYHAHDEEARHRMDSLNLLGDAGKRLPGNDKEAVSLNKEEAPSRDDPQSN